MAVAFRSASSQDVGTISSIAKPSGATTDDVLVLGTYGDSTAPTITGFTWKGSQEQNGSTAYLHWYTRVVAGGDGSTYAVTAGTIASYVCGAYSGADTTTPVNASAMGQGTSTSLVAPAITPTVNDCMLVAMYDTWENGSMTAPSGMTLAAFIGNADWEPIGQYYVLLSGGGGASTGDKTAAFSVSSQYASLLVALSPAGAAATTRRYSLPSLGVG